MNKKLIHSIKRIHTFGTCPFFLSTKKLANDIFIGNSAIFSNEILADKLHIYIYIRMSIFRKISKYSKLNHSYVFITSEELLVLAT